MSFVHRWIEMKDTLCGGRHAITADHFDIFLSKLKASGAKLVFFTDSIIQNSKFHEWLTRRNEEFEFYTEFYNRINANEPLNSIISSINQSKGLPSLFFNMKLIAAKYGDWHCSINNECDLEMAKYASENDALAVVTSDSDFLIFEGKWKFWHGQYFEVDRDDEITTIEYNRNGLASMLKISIDERPLFATLAGNGYISEFYDQLTSFHRSLGDMRSKFRNIARYIHHNAFNLKRISEDVFGVDDEKFVMLLKDSIDSYNVNFVKQASSDEFLDRLKLTPYYQHYIDYSANVTTFISVFYDFRGRYANVRPLPNLLIEWSKRKTGILRRHDVDPDFSLTILTKLSIEEDFRAIDEKPIYPDCKLSDSG